MAVAHAKETGQIGAPPNLVYTILSDYQQHHPRILPPAITDLSVVSGGVGAGTVFRVHVRAGAKSRTYRMQVSEPEPGRVLEEADLDSSLITRFTVDPAPGGSSVSIESVWDTAPGIGGVIERWLAGWMARPVYRDELALLDRYARDQLSAFGRS